AGVFSFSNLKLLNGQQLYIVVELNAALVSDSKCAAQTNLFTVGCYTQTPLIAADNNNQLTSAAPITGTSTESAGTIIRVYTSAVVLVSTTTVQANGSWSTANAGSTPAVYNAVAATSYYANAQNGTCGLSGNSATYSAASATSSGRCGTITGPVAAGAPSISGTLTGSFSTSTVNLYLDGQLIGSSITSGTSWGPITVNSTINNTLYSNGILSIGIQESGKQEVACPASAISIACTPTPAAPVFTPATTTINQYQSITYTISNAVAGSFYAPADSATGQSLGQGKWATANGSLSLTTNVVNSAGTFKVVIRSTSLSGVTQCSAVSSSGTVTVNPVVLPLTLAQFKGKKQAGNNLLEWTTVSENQLNRFEIERSADSRFFQKTGEIPAAGAGINYLFTDIHPLSRVNYYRLKMIDNDGKFSYSNLVVLTGDQQASFIHNVVPNPFTEAINVEVVVDRSQAIKITLIDIAGRIIITKDVQAQAGNNSITLTGLSKLAGGIYFIQVKTGAVLLQQKLLKVKE
ncbi:MAG TPA: T9SS type A sorting domain-containing protein, partial [Ferruginibacter sp.]|nr:T9SS type A sorting domain-containing protein [Ferruginibacter sp.]